MGASLMFAIGFMLVGLILFLIEAMIPSFGVIGLMGASSMVVSFVFAFQINHWVGFIFLVLGPIGALAVFLLGLRLLPKTRFGRSFILTGPVDENEQTVETGLDKLEGKEGIAKTMLRPSGVAIIEDKRVNVQTEGGIIDKDSRLRVIKVMGNKVFVERI